MDEFVQNKLRAYDLADQIERFKAHLIDKRAFKRLNESALKDLIPELGPRLIFLDYYKKECLSNSIKDNFEQPIWSNVRENLKEHSAKVVDSASSQQDLFEFFDANDENSLLNQLKKVTKGKVILALYEQNKPEWRNKLVSFIIDEQLKLDANRKLTKEIFIELTKKIIRTFSNEATEIYYTPSRGGMSASGMLYSRYIAVRRELRRCGILPLKEAEKNDKELACYYWLKHNKEPFSEVLEKWKSCFAIRHNQQLSTTTADYFNMFHALQLPTGYLLIESDFKYKHQNSMDMMFDKWPQLAQKLIAVACNRKNSYVIDFLKDNRDLMSKGYIVNVALLLLPLLLGTNAVKSKSQKHYRSTVIDVKNSFLLHVKTIDQYQQYVGNKNKIYRTFNLDFQPFAVMCGSIENPHTVFVVINNTQYNFQSPLKAIDFCFKSFFSLNIQYPAESAHIWTFLEKFIYCISSKTSRQSGLVTSLISEINKLS